MEATTSPPRRSVLRLPNQLLWLVGALALMWLVEVVDTIVLADRLQGGGIHPRSVDGLDGIAWAPFLHGGFRHLIGNSLPFLVLGGLVALRGVRTWLTVTITVVIVGGVATWLLARSGNHIGASGLVFGYLGYLVGAAWFERSFKAIALAAVAGFLYWGLVFGLIPGGQVSWEGHLFGAAAGIAAAYLTSDRKPVSDTSAVERP